MLYIKPNEIKSLWAQYKRNWWMFAASLAGCMLLAVAFIVIKSKKYEVYTSVDITDGGSSGSMMAALAKSSGFSDILGVGGTEVDNEIVIMSSHHVIRNAVRNIGMNISYDSRPMLKRVTYWGDSPIKITTDTPNYSDTLSVGLKWTIKVHADGKKADIYCKTTPLKDVIYDEDDIQLPADIKTLWGDFHIETTEYFKPGKSQKVKATWYSYTNIAQGLMNKMNFGLIEKKAHVVQISHEDVNPNRTIALLDAIVDEYERYTIEMKNNSTLRNMDFIQERIDTVAAELAALDSEVEHFKKVNKIGDVELQAELAIQKSSDMEEQLLQLELGINNIVMLEKYLNDPANRYEPLPLASNIKSEGSNTAILEYNNALAQMQELKQTTSASNPALQSMERALEKSRQALLLTFSNLKHDLEYSKKKISDKSNQMNTMVSAIPEVEREYVNLKRKQELKQKVYLMLLSQQEQNAVNLSVDAPKARRVDEAYVNVMPSGPTKSVVLLIALFMALFLPMAMLKVLELVNPLLRSPEQIRQMEGLDADIHVIEGKETDLDQLAYAIAQAGKDGQAKVTYLTLQGETEELTNDVSQHLGRFVEGKNIVLKKTAAFVDKSEAMYELADSDLALIAVKEGATRVENLKYIETLINKGLLKHAIVAYVKG